MAGRPIASRQQPNPEINVTPLVDVVLVLLIIFMVITPALYQGANIELPLVHKPDPKPKQFDPVDVTLLSGGKVLLNKEPIDAAELPAKLTAIHESNPRQRLMLKADKSLEYLRIREAFAMMQSIGFKGISLKVTEFKKSDS